MTVGLLSALGSVLQASNSDGVADVLDMGTAIRQTTVDQVFQKKFAEIDYRISRQGLHRDDIRDLVQVTTDRMDVFLVVGTLLLTFCMQWFSDNSVIDGKAPEWFKTLFLTTNFAAVGYLILCVWLAMHASVSASSLGARLLTSYARLSIPTRKQIQEIRKPLYPVVEKLVDAGRQLGVLKTNEDSTTTRNRFLRRGDATGTAPPVAAPSGATFGEVAEVEVLDDETDEWHFRRFLNVQSKWLSYDAYSRVSMMLGMNQLMHALSYYIVGELIMSGCNSAAFFAFFGIKMLIVMLIKLDVSGIHDWKARIAIYLFNMLPSGFAAAVLWLPLPLDERGKALLATPSFLLHMMWLFIAGEQIRPVRVSTGSTPDNMMLPRQLRTVGYLNIVELKQRKLAAAHRDSEVRQVIARVKALREETEARIQAIMEEETQAGTVNASRRSDDATLNAQRAELDSLLTQARSRCEVSRTSDDDAELCAAEQSLDRLALWQRAPEILSMLEALRLREVQGLLKPDEKILLKEAYDSFLRQCHDLNLGMSLEHSPPSVASSVFANMVRNSSSSSGAAGILGLNKRVQPSNLTAVRVAPEDAPAVRLDAPTDFGETSVWLDGRDASPLPELPTGRRVVSFREVVNTAIPNWVNEAEQVGSRSQQRSDSPEDLTPEDATPPDHLPGFLVLRFTYASVFFWLIATIVHVSTALAQQQEGPIAPPDLTWSSLPVVWPEPANFFRVNSIHCSPSRILYSDRFMYYVSARNKDSIEMPLAPIPRVASSQLVAMLCDRRGCDSVNVVPGEVNSWKLTPLAIGMGSDRLGGFLPAQHAWRASTAAWGPCSSDNCSEFWLAGWDGSEIVVMRLQRDLDPGRFREAHRFTVHPGLGRCSAPPKVCPRLKTKYTNVRSIHLAAEGRILTVVQDGGVVHAWDLTQGSFMDQWRIDGATALCHDDFGMLMARQSVKGPVLESAAHPVSFGHIYRQDLTRGLPLESMVQPASNRSSSREDFMIV